MMAIGLIYNTTTRFLDDGLCQLKCAYLLIQQEILMKKLTLITIWLSAWIIRKNKCHDGNSWWFKIVTNQT